MAHTELDLRERRAIEDMLNAKLPVSKIAAEIGRHRSSVYREIKRNKFSDEELPHLNGYYGVNAHRSAAVCELIFTNLHPSAVTCGLHLATLRHSAAIWQGPTSTAFLLQLCICSALFIPAAPFCMSVGNCLARCLALGSAQLILQPKKQLYEPGHPCHL